MSGLSRSRHWLVSCVWLLATCQGSPPVIPETTLGFTTTSTDDETGLPTTGGSATSETSTAFPDSTSTSATGEANSSLDTTTGHGSTSTGDSSSGGDEPFCGDGEVDGDESCDDGNSSDEDACLGNCTLASCGDGHVEAGVEACDDGNQIDDDGCSNACGSANCGDGIVQDGEACDDGPENSNTGACTLACFAASCGDGFVQPDNGEVCDDKNGDNADECPGTCQPAACGDGFVHAGVEACDDGDLVDTNACTSMCAHAVCGDGLIHIGVEACDADGAATPTCDPDCTAVACGDGTLNKPAGEVCDDGNLDPNDGCEPGCGFAVALAVGLHHTCIRTPEGHTRCWGYNLSGQVGNNTLYSIGCDPGEMPMPNLGVFDVREIAAGATHTCTLDTDGEVRCWGRWDSLGYGPNNYKYPPSKAVAVGAPVQQLAAGGGVTCVITDTGGVRCWGDGGLGRLGTGNTNNLGDMANELPVPDIDLGGPAVQLSAANHVCAVLESGAVKCWGSNKYGQLGVGHTNNIGDQPGEMPPATVELGAPAVQVAVGEFHSCALLADSAVKCWGLNSYGQLGQGHEQTIGDQPGEMPPTATNVGGEVVDLEVGGWVSCALLASGKVRCWGRSVATGLGPANVNGDIGDTPGDMPPADTPLGGTAVKLAVAGGGGLHMCAYMDDAKLRCWGSNEECALGLLWTETGPWVGDDDNALSYDPVPY